MTNKHQTGNKKQRRPESIDRGPKSGADRTHVAKKHRRKSLFRHEGRWKTGHASNANHPPAVLERERGVKGLGAPQKQLPPAFLLSEEEQVSECNRGGQPLYCLCWRRRINVEVCVSGRRRFHL